MTTSDRLLTSTRQPSAVSIVRPWLWPTISHTQGERFSLQTQQEWAEANCFSEEYIFLFLLLPHCLHMLWWHTRAPTIVFSYICGDILQSSLHKSPYGHSEKLRILLSTMRRNEKQLLQFSGAAITRSRPDRLGNYQRLSCKLSDRRFVSMTVITLLPGHITSMSLLSL